MKRIIYVMAITAALAFGQSVFAQGRHDINFYLGGLNSTYVNLDDGYYSNDLYGLYEPTYMLQCNPSWTLDYKYRLMNWFAVGAQANYTGMSGTVRHTLGNIPSSNISENRFSILPQVKFFIPGPKHFRLYGKVGMGMSFGFGRNMIRRPVDFAWDIVPIGCEWGGNFVYGTAEFCVGSEISGGRIGIGFRF